ncbi:MAG: FHA domain-containing protein, partial [candidate division Zixibacteria bacterium]|nr:FHA domain-containing protein [candidate division Zixibacteria bacterium]
MLKLIGTDGTRLYTFELAPGTLTVGRSSDRDICIPDKTVSRSHATVTVPRAGRSCSVTDNGSHNGTTINGRRISDVSDLKVGDKIMFGSVEFAVRDESDTSSRRAHPTTAVLSPNDPEKSVFLSINEALKPLPPAVEDLPGLFPTISEMARMLVLSEPREVMLERSL